MNGWDWRVITSRVEALAGSQPLAGHCVLLIQHGLPDLEHLIDALVQAGCTADCITIIGIPYSSRADVKQTIAARYPAIRIVFPTVVPFDGFVAVELQRLLAKCEQDDLQLIILEDGGYAVPLASQFADSGDLRTRFIAGAVEQTTRGANIDRDLFRQRGLRMPVIAIPDCALKVNPEVEPQAIAAAVNRNLRDLIVRSGIHQPETVGVIGLGSIGLTVARHQKTLGAKVFATDYDPRRVNNALMIDGFGELTRTTIPECDLLVGATGSTSIGPGVLPFLKDRAILASASSRQVEIDVPWLYSMCTEVDSGGDVPCVMDLKGYRTFVLQSDGRHITLLYDGYPVNFCGESLPDQIADIVLSLLFEAVLALTRIGPEPMIYLGGHLLKAAELEIAARSGLFLA
jgi:adenosylhomocysteinase